ncbi:MAG: amino acid adenylation domain-containing protein [bacterium]|nr:amino acid adenylation domain-containing protein [bacterium]
MPGDYPKSSFMNYEGALITTEINKESTAALNSLCRENNITLYMVLLAAYYILLYKYTGNEDIVVGTPLADRPHADLQHILGMFVNTLPMRNSIKGDMELLAFLARVKQNCLLAYENQDYQFEDLVEKLPLKREKNRNPVFNTILVLQNTGEETIKIKDLECIPFRFDKRTAKFDFSFLITERDKKLFIVLEYSTGLFKKNTMERFAGHFSNILKEITGFPEKKIGEIDILSARERKQILSDFNRTKSPYPGNKAIHQLFEEQANKKPGKTALVYRDKTLSYKELDEQANQLAHYLIDEQQVNNNSLIGIYMERSPEAIIAILGILKSGAAYVPIDPGYPENRVKTMIDDSGISLLISGKKYIKRLNKLQWECDSLKYFLCMDSSNIYGETEEEENKMMDRGLWEYAGEQARDTISGGGWQNSYTGEFLSGKEMDEYAESTFQKLKPYLHKQVKVLEIGCASGLTMFRLAPFVKRYVGTDMSRVIIEKNLRQIEKENHTNIEVRVLAAHEIDRLEENDFDIIILNSVVQYFHGHNYLRKVISRSIEHLNDTGIIYLGDIMDLDLKEELVHSLQEYKKKNPNEKTKTEFSSELFLSKRFFQDLRIEIDAVAETACSKKTYTIGNELTRFRYDAILQVNKNTKHKKTAEKKQKDQFDSTVLENRDTSRPTGRTGPGNLAYIMYTSGSTGKPKGVMITNKNVIRLVKNTNYIEFKEDDRILPTTAIVFDVTIFETWGALLNGLTLYLVDKEVVLDAKKLGSALKEYGITTLWVSTSLFNQLESQDPEIFAHLKYLVVGGEKLSAKHINEVRERCGNVQVINGYGPTENAVFSTAFSINDHYEENIPIGKPISNSTAYIMSPHNQLQPIGVFGELCVGGDGVGLGYFNRPELTAEKFIPNPFVPGETLYRTGDLARWFDDGNIDFAGRIDSQVQIRGFRVELGEIENRLAANEHIKEAAIITTNDANNNKHICAYYTVKEPGAVEIPVSLLREFLSAELPAYMIPSFFMEMKKFPLNQSGKVNRKELPNPFTKRFREHTPAITNDTEKKVRAIWEEILGFDYIEEDDDFFEIGGNSLGIVVMATKIGEEFGIEIPLTQLFKKLTIKELVSFLEKQQGSETSRKTNSRDDEMPILLNRESAKNVFCLPPGMGMALSYKALSDFFPRYFFYSFNYIDTKENIAAYTQKIISIQPTGPIVLLGYSAGGSLGFEVAKELEKNGRIVSDLIIIDRLKLSVPMEHLDSSIERRKSFEEQMLQEIRRITNDETLIKKFLDKAEKYYHFLKDKVDQKGINANIHLITSSGTENIIKDTHCASEKPDLWDGSTANKSIRYKGVGNHFDMLLPGYIEENAKIIAGILEKIDF